MQGLEKGGATASICWQVLEVKIHAIEEIVC
jgi:hypothetical protein